MPTNNKMAATFSPCGSMHVTNHKFASTSNFVWNSVSPLAGSVTSADNIEGVWMNQGLGKRRNTIDYSVRLTPRDQDMRELLFGWSDLSVHVSLYAVNKLTMQREELVDSVNITSRRAVGSGADGDLCGANGMLICPQFNHECSLRLVANENDGCLYAEVPVRIETTSMKMNRRELIVCFSLTPPEQEEEEETKLALDHKTMSLLRCAPAESQPVFVVSKIRTPHHYRHDKSIAKLRDLRNRLAGKQGHSQEWAQQIEVLAGQLVETVKAIETVDANFAPVERRKRACEGEMMSLAMTYGEFDDVDGVKRCRT
jgi:hypothetical protein